jgi:hypothetical protein
MTGGRRATRAPGAPPFSGFGEERNAAIPSSRCRVATRAMPNLRGIIFKGSHCFPVVGATGGATQARCVAPSLGVKVGSEFYAAFSNRSWKMRFLALVEP